LAGECRSDLLTLDGEPVPIRVTGATAAAATLAPLAVERCDPTTGERATAPLVLGAGDHELRAAPGADTGVDLDGLVLGSEVGGAPLTLGARGAIPPVATTRVPAPEVEVVESGRTEMKLRVRGADEPFWLVLGESENTGWQAKADGRDLGRSTLVDGYANGWLIEPGDGPITVTLSWTPQRRVWIALAISAVAVLACAVLALGRWPRRRSGAAATVPATGPVPPSPGASPADPPTLAYPWIASGVLPGRAGRIVVPALAAVAAAALIRPLAGLFVGALVLVAVHRPKWRAVLAIGAPAALALAGLYIFVQQWRHWYPSVFEWPTFFDRVHVLGWLAVIFLAADALVEFVRQPPESQSQPQNSR
jgi:hypothetical protein